MPEEERWCEDAGEVKTLLFFFLEINLATIANTFWEIDLATIANVQCGPQKPTSLTPLM